MNILLAQLDNIQYSLVGVEVINFSEYIDKDYCAEGYLKYAFEVKGIEIDVLWNVSMVQSAIQKTTNGFSVQYIPRIEFISSEIRNFPWSCQVNSEELDNWLFQFTRSVQIYEEIVDSLPIPAIDQLLLEDCLSDRDSCSD